MRCNRRLWFLKVTNFLLLTAVLTSLIVMITVMNRTPGLLGSVHLGAFKGFHEGSRAPGAFLRDFKANNQSYCRFGYHLPEKLVYEQKDLRWAPELAAKSSYRVLYNVLEASSSNASAPVTYATHVTPEFINFVAEIARSWDGSVSVAAFVPDDDADFITRQLKHFCHCLPEMSKVSVHFVFPQSHPPFVNPQLQREDNNNCLLADPAEFFSYRASRRLSYPVNLARNVARTAASTRFVMVSDVELMPSLEMASKFNEMLDRFSTLRSSVLMPSRVFVVPVFEIERYEEVPRDKQQLLKLVREEKALYFHRHLCSHCQRFPGLENWLQAASGDKIKPLMVVKREYPFHRWEPIFIGTNDEPLYSEVLSWEGKQDKMTQMLEMCLKGYRFVILDNAFLIHWPGVKRKSHEMNLQNKWRHPYISKNTRQYNIIASRLALKYKRNPRCKLQ